MSKQMAYEFVSNYYDLEKGLKLYERKSFLRFRDAMPLELSASQIENAYTAITGKSPRYIKNFNNMEPWKVERYQNAITRVIDMLNSTPTSFTDLFVAAGLDKTSSRYHIPMHSTESLRKCFKAMADAGVIECIEVRTCGKCHIRMYYIND